MHRRHAHALLLRAASVVDQRCRRRRWRTRCHLNEASTALRYQRFPLCGMATIAAGVTTAGARLFAACLHKSDMRLGDPILTARILLKGPNRRWGSTSVTGRLSWLEHNGHRVASPRPQHASKRHSGTYVGGSQLGSICHSAKPTTWPHRLMATAVVAVAQLPINGGLPTLPLAMHCHRPGRNHRPH